MGSTDVVLAIEREEYSTSSYIHYVLCDPAEIESRESIAIEWHWPQHHNIQAPADQLTIIKVLKHIPNLF